MQLRSSAPPIFAPASRRFHSRVSTPGKACSGILKQLIASESFRIPAIGKRRSRPLSGQSSIQKLQTGLDTRDGSGIADENTISES